MDEEIFFYSFKLCSTNKICLFNVVSYFKLLLLKRVPLISPPAVLHSLGLLGSCYNFKDFYVCLF